MKKKLLAAMALGVSLLTSATAANALTFTGSDATRSASATFNVVGGNLQVVLTNTSTNDVLVPVEVLTAVYFDFAGVLTPISAFLTAGSSVLFGPSNGGNVGAEWAFDAAQGISSTGLGIFGPSENFAAGNLQGPLDVDGLQYGITSAGDNSATGNTPVTGTNALIKNSVTFLLATSAFNIDSISNVVFQYGTSLTEPQITGDCIDCGPSPDPVPLPAPLLLLLSGLGGLGILGRMRRKTA